MLKVKVIIFIFSIIELFRSLGKMGGEETSVSHFAVSLYATFLSMNAVVELLFR